MLDCNQYLEKRINELSTQNLELKIKNSELELKISRLEEQLLKNSLASQLDEYEKWLESDASNDLVNAYNESYKNGTIDS